MMSGLSSMGSGMAVFPILTFVILLQISLMCSTFCSRHAIFLDFVDFFIHCFHRLKFIIFVVFYRVSVKEADCIA